MPADPPHDLIAELNPEQRRAVTCPDGPLLVIAGAGTGKTTVLAHRVAWLVATGVDPARILLLTFTRRAAAQMLHRADRLLRRHCPEALASARVWGGTFHSIAARLIRMHAHDLRLPTAFSIVDRADAEDLMHLCRTQLGLGRGRERFPQRSTCLDIYSRCVNAGERLSTVLAERFPWCRHAEEGLASLFTAYTEEKERQGVLDYDDLLLYLRALLSHPAAGDTVRARFDHVLVDEYQDTNAIQADIVARLRPDGSGLMCVGDDAQAIYAFRAATVENILAFPQRFPGTTVVTLTENYRSTAPILAATNAIIAECERGYPKDLRASRPGGSPPRLVRCIDEAEQSAWVAQRVLDHFEQGIALRRQAVLFRAQHHAAMLEVELGQRAIPYRKYGGLRFTETAHVKDLVSFLRLGTNPRDATAALRVLQLLPGVGPARAQALHEKLVAADGDFEVWVGTDVPAETAPHWPDLVALFRGLAGSEAPASAHIHAVRAVYEPLLARRYDDAGSRIADLEALEAVASRFADVHALIAELATDPPAWSGDLAGPPVLDEDWLVLSTIHSAKGLEFDVVYVIHAADGNIPSDMATGSPDEIDEERRLFYVACTRARGHLYITHPLRYYRAGDRMTDAHGHAPLSRFLSERVLSCFERISAKPAPEGDTGHDPPTGTPLEVRDQLRSLWS